jgi:hypothetical protein
MRSSIRVDKRYWFKRIYQDVNYPVIALKKHYEMLKKSLEEGEFYNKQRSPPSPVPEKAKSGPERIYQ